MTKYIAYFFTALVFFSCKKENSKDCLKSNGSEITIDRNIDSFATVIVNDKIDLNIVRGTKYKVEVTAGKNIIGNVATVNSNYVLEISNNNKCNFVRGYKRRVLVTITVPTIRKIINNGVGTVKCNSDLVQDSIFVRAENSGDIHLNGQFKLLQTSSHGNGDIYLNGVCDKLYVYMFGTNFLKGENLKVNNYIFIETISIGDCTINAPQGGTLDYNLWRSGNIYYTGDPAVINNLSDGSGKGKLIKK